MNKDLVSAFGGEYICREKKKDNRYNLHYSIQNGNVNSCENEIYELILSFNIDGLIFLAVSFTDSIISFLKKGAEEIYICLREYLK